MTKILISLHLLTSELETDVFNFLQVQDCWYVPEDCLMISTSFLLVRRECLA
jgi:hypothetical protein